MAEYTPDEEQILWTYAEVVYNTSQGMVGRDEGYEEARRGIEKIKANALVEWADAQDSLVEGYLGMSNEDGRAESYRWTKAVRLYANRMESDND